jgi:hypothetical protein
MQNTINNAAQSDTKRGEITLPAIAAQVTVGDIGINRLVKIVTNGGKAQFSLPTALTDKAPIFIASQYNGGAISAEVPSTNEDARLFAYGTGNAGDLLILADPTANSGAQAGMVRSATGNHAPSSSSGAVFCWGIAEEVFVDGQYVKARFLPSVQTF